MDGPVPKLNEIPMMELPRKLQTFSRDLQLKIVDSKIKSLKTGILGSVISTVFLVLTIYGCLKGVSSSCLQLMPLLFGVFGTGFLFFGVSLAIDVLNNRRALAARKTITSQDYFWYQLFTELDRLNSEILEYNNMLRRLSEVTDASEINEKLVHLRADILARRSSFETRFQQALAIADKDYFTVSLIDRSCVLLSLKKYPEWRELLTKP